MSNLRIVSDNAADRATLTASSTAGALAVTNLQTDTKSDVWRATGIAASIHATWPMLETIQAVALPFCNLSPTATMRVRLTNETPSANLITYSQQMENTGSWSQTAVTVTSGIPAPDGTTSAVYLQDTTANSVHEIRTSVVAFTSGNYYTISAFLKAGTRQFGYVGLPTAGFGQPTYVIFDLTSGIPALVVGTPFTYGITPVPGMPGWYRCSVTAQATITASGTCYLGMKATAAAGTYTGDGNSWLYAWGCQVELGYATSYYPTTSSAATRPLGYIDGWQSYAYDSGAVLACPAPAVTLRGWTAAQAASAYAYGGGAYARMWLPAAQQAYGMTIDIVDTNNLQGYVEAARLVAGPYWSPTYNASDASMTVVDTTELYRTDAGDQGANAGYTYRRVPINLSAMPAADRAALVSILRDSRAYPILLSVFPGSSDLALERDNMVYGRRSKDSDVAIQYAAAYSTTIEIEEI